MLIRLRERFARTYHARTLEVTPLCGEYPLVDIALDGTLVTSEFGGGCDADVMNGLSVLDFRGNEFIEMLEFPILQRGTLSVFAQNLEVVLVSFVGNVELLELVAALLVLATIAYFCRACVTFLASDELDIGADCVAVVNTTTRTRCATTRAVCTAQIAELTILTMNTLIHTPVAPLRACAGVLFDLSRDGRWMYIDLLCDGSQ